VKGLFVQTNFGLLACASGFYRISLIFAIQIGKLFDDSELSYGH
jgi:hypothetical protein